MIPNDKEINPAANVTVLTIYIYLKRMENIYTKVTVKRRNTNHNQFNIALFVVIEQADKISRDREDLKLIYGDRLTLRSTIQQTVLNILLHLKGMCIR